MMNFSGLAISPPSSQPAAWYTMLVRLCTEAHRLFEVSHIACPSGTLAAQTPDERKGNL